MLLMGHVALMPTLPLPLHVTYKCNYNTFLFLFLIVRDATGVVLHKDSKWYQQWKEFKDNNPVVTGKKPLQLDVGKSCF